MTICFPGIITSRICPRDELQFSNTPPTCVRVVPVYNDATYVVSQFPPPVHFLVTDEGLVYQLADIQSPPSTPPEYHALLDSTGCILVGVEFSSVTSSTITSAQVEVLPGVLRYVLATLSLPVTSVTNTMPVPRCRRQLWDEIIAATTDCLGQTPPQPPTPPSLTCAFVLSCLSAGQNINITAGGNISAGQLVQGPNPGEYTWVTPSGAPSFTFSPSGSISVADTPTVDMVLAAGPTISANVIVSPVTGNQLQITSQGLFVPPISLNVNDTLTVDLSLTGGVLTADVIVSPAPNNQLQATAQGLYVPPGTNTPCFGTAPNTSGFPANGPLTIYNSNTTCLEQLNLNAEAVVYGDPNGSGRPQNVNLYYNPVRNTMWAVDGTASPPSSYQNSLFIAHGNASISGAGTQFMGAVGQSVLNSAYTSLANVFSSSVQTIVSSIVVGQGLTIVQAENSLLSGQESSTTVLTRSLLVNGDSSVNSFTSSVGIVQYSTVPNVAESFVSIDDEQPSLFSITRSVYLGRTNNIGANVNLYNSFVVSTNSNVNSTNINYCFASLERSQTQTSSLVGSFVFAEESSLAGLNYSVVSISRNTQQINTESSVVLNTRGVAQQRIGPASPLIYCASILNAGEVPNARRGFLAATQGVPFNTFEQSIFAALNFNFPDPNPPNNVVDVFNTVIVGRDLQFDPVTTTVQNKLVVGAGLTVGRDTSLAVGFNNVVTPAQLAAGGYTVVVGDGGADNLFEVWGSGVWRYRSSGSFADNAAAIAALNAAYGSDPRIAGASFAVATVAGTPALFAWNGSSFVRITV